MTHNLKEFCFDRYRLDVAERCLFRDGELIPLTGKEFEMLHFLLEAGGRLVTKEQLFARVWPDTAVEESNLFQHIRSLRRKLGTRRDGGEFIKNIHGRGYCFLPGEAAGKSEDAETAAALLVSEAVDGAVRDSQPVRRHFPWSKISAAACLLILIAGGVFFAHWRSVGSSGRAAVSIAVVDGTEDPVLAKLVQFIEVGRNPVNTVLSGDQRELYVTEHDDNSVAVIDIAAKRVAARIPVGATPNQALLSPDGKRVYIATDGGQLAAIDTQEKKLIPILNSGEPIISFALSPDGKYAYLALGFQGLGKVDLASASMKIVSTTVYVQALAFAEDGRTLVVSYQAGGPGGTSGHDAIGYFDSSTDRLVGVSKGFPNVGDDLSLFSTGTQMWEIGADACDGPQYDHVGCPAIPAGLINILDTRRQALVRRIGVRGARLLRCSFSPTREFAAITTSDRLILMSTANFSLVATLPFKSHGRVAFSSDGNGFLPLPFQSAVAVLRFVVPVRVLHLENDALPDDAFELAIVGDPKLEEAKYIDPTTIRLGGEPVRKTAAGSLDASLKALTGYLGDSLIVRFNKSAFRGGSPLVLEGKTYSGLPVRGTVDF
jgi:YVTN family beta-propeller protein